jgi:Cu(I)/Ag(I) efflux system membrane fusion protein
MRSSTPAHPGRDGEAAGAASPPDMSRAPQRRPGRLRLSRMIILALGLLAGGAGGYGLARLPPTPTPTPPAVAALSRTASAAARKILYYRDPGGAPFWSATPRQDAQGRDYLPVHDDEEISFDPPAPAVPGTAAAGERKILYYRNPMGLPDISPAPKKDSMGMDYIPVYEDEAGDDGATVKVSLDKVQRSGVRTGKATLRPVVRPVRAVGTVAFDERRQTVVTLRAEGFIEDLFVNATGQPVRAGEPLFRVYSPEIQRAQIDLLAAMRWAQGGTGVPESARNIEGAMQRLRNLGVPESRIREIRETGANPRTTDWPAPTTGTVTAKQVILGQRVAPGDELYRIVDLSRVWVIADVAESDLAEIAVGSRATMTFRAYAARPVEGEVTFIYPELRAQTRTARVRIEVPNEDGRLKADMYADVLFHGGAGTQPVLAVPASAVIDSGSRQVVLIARGEGRFEPRPVRLGRRDDGHAEVLDGLGVDEEIVTSATFLIDAESNLRTALDAFARQSGSFAPASGKESSRSEAPK